MRNRFKSIMVAGAIALSAIGIGSAAAGTVQAATPYTCSVQNIGSYRSDYNLYSGARGRCQNGSNPLMAYRIVVECSFGTKYGSPQVYPSWSTVYCPTGQWAYSKYMQIY